jgi:hypothetical protein
VESGEPCDRQKPPVSVMIIHGSFPLWSGNQHRLINRWQENEKYIIILFKMVCFYHNLGKSNSLAFG